MAFTVQVPTLSNGEGKHSVPFLLAFDMYERQFVFYVFKF